VANYAEYFMRGVIFQVDIGQTAPEALKVIEFKNPRDYAGTLRVIVRGNMLECGSLC
jgi:hypothetical protein